MLLQSTARRDVSFPMPGMLRLQTAARSAAPAWPRSSIAVPAARGVMPPSADRPTSAGLSPSEDRRESATGASPSDVDHTAADETAAPKRSRAEQSRINGAKSRGPSTADGQAAVRHNALKHGLTAACVLMPGEDPALFLAWATDFYRELRPAGTVQEALVQRAAEIAWRLRRLPILEAHLLGRCAGDESPDPEQWMKGWAKEVIGDEHDGMLMCLQRYETRLERSYSNCMRELRLLQRDGLNRPEVPASGPTEFAKAVAETAAEPEEDPSGSFGTAESNAADLDASDDDAINLADSAANEAADFQPSVEDDDVSGSFGAEGPSACAGEPDGVDSAPALADGR